MPPVTIKYRAVHKNTAWRKVHGHTSLQNALYGQKDGAPGLFEHRARIDYKKHGEPLYVAIWMDTEPLGFLVKKDILSSDGMMRVQVETALLQAYDDKGGASATELEGHFSSPAVDRATTKKLPLNEASIDQAEEGAITLQQHFLRERNATLAEAKKAEVFRTTGCLACEVCGFDFAAAYGELGNYYCEVHHTQSLCLRKGSEKTSLHELAILCSNCHGIIHRTEPMWGISSLVAHLKSIRAKHP